MTMPRVCHEGILLTNGTVLIVGGSDGNVLTGNVSNLNHGTGANGDPSGGILIDGATGNRLDGNVANDNVRRGIEAAEGNVDGGGNKASGNGLEPQCVGVACG